MSILPGFFCLTEGWGLEQVFSAVFFVLQIRAGHVSYSNVSNSVVLNSFSSSVL